MNLFNTTIKQSHLKSLQKMSDFGWNWNDRYNIFVSVWLETEFFFFYFAIGPDTSSVYIVYINLLLSNFV